MTSLEDTSGVAILVFLYMLLQGAELCEGSPFCSKLCGKAVASVVGATIRALIYDVWYFATFFFACSIMLDKNSFTLFKLTATDRVKHCLEEKHCRKLDQQISSYRDSR